jgi:spore coat polysaccharide biosynthesis protein SpsF (cytidylyltransferase family)
VEVPAIRAGRGVAAQSAGSLVGRRFAGKSLLEWVVRRVTESLLVDQVVVVTDPAQGDVARRLAPADIPVFVGIQSDALGRFAAAAREFQATHVVRVPLGCPFVDPELIDRLVCTASGHTGFDYIGYFSVDGRPAILSKVGLFAEWCRATAVQSADAQARSSEDRADPTRYIYAHPEDYQLRFIPVPAKLDRRDVRLTVDVEEDWEHVHMIFDALGPDSLDWRRIAALLDEQPELRERMAVLNESERTA